MSLDRLARDERFRAFQVRRIGNSEDDQAEDGAMKLIAGILVISLMLGSVAFAANPKVPTKL
ncbi:MAG: hypothetical protein ABIS14_04790, partial [Sphingomonas sp.]